MYQHCVLIGVSLISRRIYSFSTQDSTCDTHTSLPYQHVGFTYGSDEILQYIVYHRTQSGEYVSHPFSLGKTVYSGSWRTVGSFSERLQGSPMVISSQLCFAIRRRGETGQSLYTEKRPLPLLLDASRAPCSNSPR